MNDHTPNTDWPTIKAAFNRLADLPLAERQRELARLQREDPALHAELDALFRSHDSEESAAQDFSARTPRTPHAHSTVTALLDHKPGELIGRYRLAERLGEGGFGVVFAAEQVEPIRRSVALKIVKLGMDTASVVARFDAERQALAQMDHPNIARVFDAGATGAGRPYFVMERIHGQPIHTYCDSARLPVKRRLELMVSVCRGVQHAHHKGIIHRDLKPGNVLIAVNNGSPAPKIIDFGIAKAVNASTTDPAITGLSQLLGTPEYMSPEQAAGSNDLDTRTDVYSLGIMLYQLLTGATPFSGKQLRSASFDEARRMVREEHPSAPSTRLATPDPASAQIAHARSTDIAHLTASIKGDLDWVVLRALEKDPNRRYDSPEALAADLERHLRNEPVAAGPPTITYKLRKFIARRKGTVAAAVLILAASAVGLSGLVVGLVQAQRQRDIANKATEQADAARIATGLESLKYKAASDFLRQMISSAGPEGQSGKETTVRETLDTASAAIENGSLRNEPNVEATVRLAIGASYLYLGLPAKAEPHLQRSLELHTSLSGPEHPNTAECYIELAILEADRNHLPESERLAANAVRILEPIVPMHSEMWSALRVLGSAQIANGKQQEGLATLGRSIAAAEESFGPDSPNVAGARLFMATLMHAQEGGLELATRALESYRKSYGPKHPETARTLNIIGRQLHLQGRYEDAERNYTEALAITSETLGPASAASIENRFTLAWLADSRKDFAVSRQRWQEVVDLSRITFGRISGPVATALNRQAVSLQKAGLIQEAEPVYQEVLTLYAPPNGLPPDIVFVYASLSLSGYAERRNDIAALLPLAQGVLALDAAVIPPEHWTRAQAKGFLGTCVASTARFPEAEALLVGSYNQLNTHPATTKADFPFQAARRLERLYEAWNKAEPTEQRQASAAQWKQTADQHRERLKAANVPFVDR